MRNLPANTFLVGLGFAVLALLLVLIVVVPVFWLVRVIYNNGHGLVPLLVAVVAAWALLAWLLSRRRVRL
jgi:hypothetical protein